MICIVLTAILSIGFHLKGLYEFFPKFWNYSVETVDKAGKRQDPTYVSELPYLQTPCPQSWSVCQPVLAPSRLQVLAENLYNPIDITLCCDLYSNHSLPDKGMCPFNITYAHVWESAYFLSRISQDVEQNISTYVTIWDDCNLSVGSWGRAKIEGIYCWFAECLFWILFISILTV